jgi:hypothetical protein
MWAKQLKMQKYSKCCSLCVSCSLYEAAAFWAIVPCSLVEVYLCFIGACCLHHQGDEWGSKHLWNIGKLLPDYTAQQPRRYWSWYSLPWEPEISHVLIMFPLFNIWIEVDINVGPISFGEIWYRINNKQKNWVGPIIDKLRLDLRVLQTQ